MLRTHNCGELLKEDTGKEVTLAGWVSTHRISGKISFILLRDRYGITQIFVNPQITKEIGELKRETVLQVRGKVNERPENQIKKEMKTGAVELEALEVKIISQAVPLPLELDENIETNS